MAFSLFSLSSEEIGSSARMTCGSLTNALTIASLCLWPPDSETLSLFDNVGATYGASRRNCKEANNGIKNRFIFAAKQLFRQQIESQVIRGGDRVLDEAEVLRRQFQQRVDFIVLVSQNYFRRFRVAVLGLRLNQIRFPK